MFVMSCHEWCVRGLQCDSNLRYNTWLLIKLAPEGVVFTVSFSFSFIVWWLSLWLQVCESARARVEGAISHHQSHRGQNTADAQGGRPDMAPRASPTHEGGSPCFTLQISCNLSPRWFRPVCCCSAFFWDSELLPCHWWKLIISPKSFVGSCVSMRARVWG